MSESGSGFIGNAWIRLHKTGPLLPYLALILGIVADPVVGNLVPQSLLHMPIYRGKRQHYHKQTTTKKTTFIQLSVVVSTKDMLETIRYGTRPV